MLLEGLLKKKSLAVSVVLQIISLIALNGKKVVSQVKELADF